MLIVSIHIPKTAGTSLGNEWVRLLGQSRVAFSYTKNPLLSTSGESIQLDIGEDIDVLHGHFTAEAGLSLKPEFALSFLRHPIDNLCSIYFFFLASRKCLWGLNYMNPPNFRELVEMPQFRFLYSKTFIGNSAANKLDFIGDCADYSGSLDELGKRLGLIFSSTTRENVTKDIHGCHSIYKNDRAVIVNKLKQDTSLLARLKEDIDFYETYTNKHKK